MVFTLLESGALMHCFNQGEDRQTTRATHMSGQEIERKFLVEKGDAYRKEAFASSHIVQGYIPLRGRNGAYS